jgi:4-amino-4-deoxy-L-arabinose transferase-like glycosyltransferase
MSEPPPFRLADFLLLVLVVAAAAGARCWYLTACADGGSNSGPLQVQGPPPPEAEALAQGLRDRQEFLGRAPLAAQEEWTAHAAPGYPALLALAARLPFERDLAVRWGQAALGALTAGLYFLFARRAFHHVLVAALGGLLYALYPFAVANAAEVNDGTLVSFGLALVLWLGARCGQSGGAFGSLLYGLGLAGLALVRAALLPFGFVAVLWFLLRCRTLPRGWLYGLLAFLGFVNGLVPWALRNYQGTGDMVPVVDSAYLQLWEGNNPKATGGPLTEADLVEALAEARHEAPGQVRAQLEKLPQKERYASLAADVVREVEHNPAGTLRRRIWAGLYFVFGEKWFREQAAWVWDTSASPEIPAWFSRNIEVALLGSLLGMLLLGFAGWRWTYAWCREALPSSLAVVWVALPYLLSHGEWLAGPRLPLDGLLLCYAAFTLVALVPRLGAPLRRGPGLRTADGD